MRLASARDSPPQVLNRLSSLYLAFALNKLVARTAVTEIALGARCPQPPGLSPNLTTHDVRESLMRRFEYRAFIAGGIAACGAVTVTHSFETVKVRYVQSSQTTR